MSLATKKGLISSFDTDEGLVVIRKVYRARGTLHFGVAPLDLPYFSSFLVISGNLAKYANIVSFLLDHDMSSYVYSILIIKLLFLK